MEYLLSAYNEDNTFICDESFRTHFQAHARERPLTPPPVVRIDFDNPKTPENQKTKPANTLPLPLPPDVIRRQEIPILLSPEFLLMAHPVPDWTPLASLKDPYIIESFPPRNQHDKSIEATDQHMYHYPIVEQQVITVCRGLLQGAIGRVTSTLSVSGKPNGQYLVSFENNNRHYIMTSDHMRSVEVGDLTSINDLTLTHQQLCNTLPATLLNFNSSLESFETPSSLVSTLDRATPSRKAKTPRTQSSSTSEAVRDISVVSKKRNKHRDTDESLSIQ